MPFIPHTEQDVREMLAAIGAPTVDALFDEIPASLRIKGLDGIPEGLNEMQVGRLMSERARQDGRPLAFLGAGAYEHHIPSAVWAITTRGEFYSAYTPYQAEASQGTLQVIYEYQTMIASLTGMQVSNASLYDGGSAVAEAALMAVRAHRRSKSLRILVPTTVHPHYRKVAVSTAGNQGLRFEEVPYERIVNADAEPGAWLTYSGTYKSQRYSSLDQITRDNVKALRPVWMYQVADAGYVETTPLVVDGVMYVTEPPTVVTALDLKSGRMLWTWSRTLPANLRTLGFGRVNRGVAVMDDMVFVGTLDGALVALDAKTGAVRWETKVADNKSGHAITAAPLAIKGKVLVGISGGEAGIRGFIDAYDARSGDLAWRQLPGDIGHAVGRMGSALARLPGAELRVEIVARQTQQRGRGR